MIGAAMTAEDLRNAENVNAAGAAGRSMQCAETLSDEGDAVLLVVLASLNGTPSVKLVDSCSH